MHKTLTNDETEESAIMPT